MGGIRKWARPTHSQTKEEIELQAKRLGLLEMFVKLLIAALQLWVLYKTSGLINGGVSWIFAARRMSE